MSSSSSYVLQISSVSEAGGISQSPNGQMVSSVGQPLVLGTLSSLNFEFEAGDLAAPEQFDPGSAPIVFGVARGAGDAQGGEAALVFGLNFRAPGASTPAVFVGGAPAARVQVASDSALRVELPAGLNAFGNPLGAVSVKVANELGTGQCDAAYVYLPALVPGDAARVDGWIDMHYLGEPGSMVQLASGSGGPGQRHEPLAGALELLPGWRWLGPPALAATGELHFRLRVPSAANFAGSVLDFQAVSLAQGAASASALAPQTGSFTNKLTVTVQP